MSALKGYKINTLCVHVVHSQMNVFRRSLKGIGIALITWVAVRHVVPPEIIDMQKDSEHKVHVARRFNCVLADYIDMLEEREGHLQRSRGWYMWRQRFSSDVERHL